MASYSVSAPRGVCVRSLSLRDNSPTYRTSRAPHPVRLSRPLCEVVWRASSLVASVVCHLLCVMLHAVWCLSHLRTRDKGYRRERVDRSVVQYSYQDIYMWGDTGRFPPNFKMLWTHSVLGLYTDYMHWTHRWHRRVICWCISQQARHRRDGTRLATRPRRRARRAPGPA